MRLSKDIKVVPSNKLAKVKLKLRAKLAEEIQFHKTFPDSRNSIASLVIMIDMANGLPYKHQDPTTAIYVVDVQLESDSADPLFAMDQDRVLN